MDASLWERTRKKGPDAIRRAINSGLENTSVTCVLIGANTYKRPWVNYEISRSIARSNGLIGVRIHNLKDRLGKTSEPGPVPAPLKKAGSRIYTWDRNKFGEWVEQAARDAASVEERPKGFLDWLFGGL